MDSGKVFRLTPAYCNPARRADSACETVDMFTLFGFFMPGLPEILIVGAIILLLFGNRLPGVMRSLGRSVVEFKKGIRDDTQDGDSPDSGKVEEKGKQEEAAK